MAERTVTGRKYRIKSAENLWDLISFWTKSVDVEMNNGDNLEHSFSQLQNTTAQHTNSINILNENGNAEVTTAPEYDRTKKYEKGDIVSYNDSQYYCIVDITTPEAWNVDHWNLIVDEVPFKFGIDADGNYGYIKAGADSVIPFSKTSAIYLGSFNGGGTFYLKNYGIKESVWSTLTVNDFVVGGGNASAHSGWYYTEGFHGVGGSFHVSKSYDPVNGALTVSAYVSVSGDETISAAAPVYATYVAPQR